MMPIAKTLSYTNCHHLDSTNNCDWVGREEGRGGDGIEIMKKLDGVASFLADPPQSNFNTL